MLIKHGLIARYSNLIRGLLHVKKFIAFLFFTQPFSSFEDVHTMIHCRLNAIS